MEVFINNEQDSICIPEEINGIIEEIVELILKKELSKSNYEVSISYVDDERIRELNAIYRGKDRPTDVLSFPLLEADNLELDSSIDEGEILLGDIVISLETANRQAEEYGHTLKREICYLVIHSMYHLLGYDHMEAEEKKEMREKEKSIARDMEIFKGEMV